MSALINFAVNVLILGVIAHWIMNNFVHSYREEVVKIRELLDRVFTDAGFYPRNYQTHYTIRFVG
ncbi:MAG: hypothetical protein R3C26_14210 [Calditrichia bacterium]